VTGIEIKSPHALLRKRYDDQKGAWVYLTEVRNATGYKANSAVDALALSLWPSRGIELHGHEIKVSRGDWLRELKDVTKSQPIQRYCDRWWLVVGDPDIVQPGELPPTWGLMAVKGGRLVAVKEAPKLEREEWSPTFVAAFFRGFMKDIDHGWVRKDIHAKLEQQLRDLDPEIEARVQERLAQERRRSEDGANERLRESLARFEEVVGQPLDRYNGERLGELVKLAQVIRDAGAHRTLTYAINQAELVVGRLRAAQTAMEVMNPDNLTPAAIAAAARAASCTCEEGTVGQRCATTQKWVSFDCPVHGR
jgi:hypothetical protein